MSWKKIGAVLRREYVEHIRRKMFWVFTILMPLVWIGFIAISIFTQTHMTGRKTIAVVSDDPKLFEALQSALEEGRDKGKVDVVLREPGPGGVSALLPRLKDEIEKKKLDAYVVLTPDAIESGKVSYRAPSISDYVFQERLESRINTALLHERLAGRGLSPEVIAQAEKRVSIDSKRLDEKAGGGFFASFIFFIFLYATLIQYGYINLRGVIEEKSNRIVEIIISSVRPTELMIGKIVGIGLVGLTQYAIWSIIAMNLSLVSGMGIAGLSGSEIPTIPLSTIAFFILYFLLGYFLYASIFTAIGAPFNTDQEAQQLSMIPTMMIVSVWAFWPLIINDPNSTISTVLSLIPFLTPMVMFFRVTLAPVPAWQIGLSVVFMLATIVGMAWFAGKIYRVGILMYGKKPTVPEIFRWLRRPSEPPAEPEPGDAQA